MELMKIYGVQSVICPFRATTLEAVGTSTQNENVTIKQMKKEANDKSCIYELKGSFPPIAYNYIRSCKTAQEIWNTL